MNKNSKKQYQKGDLCDNCQQPDDFDCSNCKETWLKDDFLHENDVKSRPMPPDEPEGKPKKKRKVKPKEETKVEIFTRYDEKRGCGYRKPAGVYLVSDGMATTCNRLPIPLNICPCCGAGVKFSRGFTWIQPKKLFPELSPCMGCPGCFYTPSKEIAGLLWVGEKFYSPHSFLTESAAQGVSRRLSTVPHSFEVGKTWVYFAHKHAVTLEDGTTGPGIFAAFCPTRIEYVVTGKETEDKLQRLIRRGFTLVHVKPKQVDLIEGDK